MGRGRHHPPIAGLGGEHTGVPMASLMIAGAAASMIGLLVVAKPEATPTRAVRDVLD
jgi:DHA1 family bicyclomycin/chloramphenicol resistance-like MFS transporter